MLAAQAAAESEGDIDVDDLSVDVAGTIESQAETDEAPADEAADTTDEAAADTTDEAAADTTDEAAADTTDEAAADTTDEA
jgi:hypothetical protein